MEAGVFCMSTRPKFLSFNVVLAFSFMLALGFPACGGGGGGSGSGGTGAGKAGITLTSISFPEYTDLSGGTTEPPLIAPLSQQVVLTFSGPVKGSVSTGAILINAHPGLDYHGPEVALSKTQNLIPARGDLRGEEQTSSSSRPSSPLETIDLSVNARAECVPGLLPGYARTPSSSPWAQQVPWRTL